VAAVFRYDQLGALERGELDPKKFAELVIELASIANGGLPMVITGFFDKHAAVSNQLHNYRPTGLSRTWSRSWVWGG
jgi:hypothetical protein